jgi:hypothetical protein
MILLIIDRKWEWLMRIFGDLGLIYPAVLAQRKPGSVSITTYLSDNEKLAIQHIAYKCHMHKRQGKCSRIPQLLIRNMLSTADCKCP